MANVNLVIPDAHLPRVIHALCATEGLAESPANAKAALVAHVKRVVRRVEKIEAEEAAIEDVTLPSVDDVAG